jgi:branched-chain amino acid transport system substrate-binding protein
VIRRRVLLGVLAAGVLSCGDPPPIRVGVVSSVEGVDGARFAAAEVNATGGIRGRPLVLRIIGGSGTEARAAIIAAESLSIDRTVVAVVGHSNSSASLAASQIYNARRIVQIAPTSSAAILTDAGPHTFRLVASDIHQARFLADELVRRAVTSAAAFYVNDDYGRSLFRELRARLADAQVHLAFESPYSELDTLPDAEATVRALAQAGTTDIVWLGRLVQLRAVLPLLRRHIPNARVLASDGVDGREITLNDGGVFTGVQYVCFVDVHAPRPQLAALRERYRARTGQALTAELALSYDAVMLIATAAREAGPDRNAVLRYLQSLGRARPAFPGATGDIAFDDSGDPRPSYCLMEVSAGGVRAVRPQGAR